MYPLLAAAALLVAPSTAALSQSAPKTDSDWTTAYAQARSYLSQFTLEEKVNLTTGVGWQGGHCVGNIPAIPRVNFPGLCLQDSPVGVRFADRVSVFPTGINTAATFDRELIRARGEAMGAEFRAKGVNIALGPMMNMGRVAQGGRNWEGFGADPFLTGEAAYETIVGMQSQGIQACAKHYINNEQEHNRTLESSIVDDRFQHEIYTHPFLRSVAAGVASVMCSYKKVNGTYACGNDEMLNDVLKHQIGFKGLVVSDWSATMSTMSASAGLDMTMPGDITFFSGDSYFGGNLTQAVNNGTIPESRVDDMATRILAAWFLLGQNSSSYPPVSFDSFNINDPVQQHIDVQADHYKIIRKIGAASTVLLKNTNKTLPLNKPKSIALIGSDAGPASQGPNSFGDQGGDIGTLALGWGSGTANFSYLVSPLEAIQAQARKDHSSISWYLEDFNTYAAAIAGAYADVAIVFLNADSGEDYITVDGNEGDRKNLTAWHNGDNLVNAVARQNKNTVVVVHSVGPLIVEPWIDNENVTAVLWAGLPGQESGNSLVDVLYGVWNPSGRLAYTIAKDPSDYPAGIVDNSLDIPYTEGLEIDYRHFDAKNITPRFEFGFGLSYTEFAYANLKVTQVNTDTSDAEKTWASGKVASSDVGASLADWLHATYYCVSVDITNTGGVYGAEIPQLYLNPPAAANSPPSILRGFTSLPLDPGKTGTAQFNISRYDMSVWDVVQQGWIKPEGTYGLFVGASSRDKKLEGQLA
ncbi:glycoside hydrolase family 3 protein [Botryobasidium botryosum FD-172 SS1]|uniref:beta-glucosidase n=1 Tax=Botryobasidium botryosum (strain FD-172 SS1) TaxID=930990 RepID=A0A067MKN2_BOTB1|nr:glycoside hydrolase family 3 protein [Botryobasidium botryosum FD-172 SS1]